MTELSVGPFSRRNNKNIKLEKIAIEWSYKVGALMMILLFKFR
jgi:hypothetical protein